MHAYKCKLWCWQVKGVLDKEEVLFAKHKGYLFGAHVVVGLPDCLAEASKGPDAVSIMQHTKAVAVDEVDACFLVRCCWFPPAPTTLPCKPLTLLVPTHTPFFAARGHMGGCSSLHCTDVTGCTLVLKVHAGAPCNETRYLLSAPHFSCGVIAFPTVLQFCP